LIGLNRVLSASIVRLGFERVVMSTADALRRAIIDRPDDDLPRLAYADALDEAGDPARAEFIRVEVELARIPEHDPTRPALEDREHDLLAAHEVPWLGDLASPGREPGDELVEWHWHRGFVEEVAASPRWMLDHADGLFAAHPARRWRVLAGQREDALLPHDPGRDRWVSLIEALDFGSFGHPVDASGFLLRYGRFPSLKELDLACLPGASHLDYVLECVGDPGRLKTIRCGGVADEAPLNPLRLASLLRTARLTELTLPNTGLTTYGLRYLLAAPCCRELASLDVRDNDLGPDAWRAFDAAPCRLRELDLSGTPLGAFALDRVLGCDSTSELRSLELNRCGSAVANVRALAGSRFWRQAEDLRMHNGTIPARALEPLWEQPDGPAALRALDLSDNYLYDAGVAELAAAEWSGSLTWLALSRNYLTDDAARTLAAGRFAHLRTLHLSYNHSRHLEGDDFAGAITDAGAAALAEAPALANLRLLALSGTNLGPDGVDALLNGRYWRLAGLGLGRCNLPAAAARVLAGSPRLRRLTYLDLSTNYGFGGDALLPLAESPHLCPLLELDLRGVPASDRVRAALRGRLGRRLSG
jgi:uncharacterized protein (TIGR02996 family)